MPIITLGGGPSTTGKPAVTTGALLPIENSFNTAMLLKLDKIVKATTLGAPNEWVDSKLLHDELAKLVKGMLRVPKVDNLKDLSELKAEPFTITGVISVGYDYIYTPNPTPAQILSTLNVKSTTSAGTWLYIDKVGGIRGSTLNSLGDLKALEARDFELRKVKDEDATYQFTKQPTSDDKSNTANVADAANEGLWIKQSKLMSVPDNNPIGAMIMFGGDAIPGGYLHCDGRSLSKTAYAELYAVIGDRWGTEPGKFKLPPEGWYTSGSLGNVGKTTVGRTNNISMITFTDQNVRSAVAVGDGFAVQTAFSANGTAIDNHGLQIQTAKGESYPTHRVAIMLIKYTNAGGAGAAVRTDSIEPWASNLLYRASSSFLITPTADATDITGAKVKKDKSYIAIYVEPLQKTPSDNLAGATLDAAEIAKMITLTSTALHTLEKDNDNLVLKHDGKEVATKDLSVYKTWTGSADVVDDLPPESKEVGKLSIVMVGDEQNPSGIYEGKGGSAAMVKGFDNKVPLHIFRTNSNAVDEDSHVLLTDKCKRVTLPKAIKGRIMVFVKTHNKLGLLKAAANEEFTVVNKTTKDGLLSLNKSDEPVTLVAYTGGWLAVEGGF
jgi:microcystin-dependent protein